jgi:hypothetical protein
MCGICHRLQGHCRQSLFERNPRRTMQKGAADGLGLLLTFMGRGHEWEHTRWSVCLESLVCLFSSVGSTAPAWAKPDVAVGSMISAGAITLPGSHRFAGF